MDFSHFRGFPGPLRSKKTLFLPPTPRPNVPILRPRIGVERDIERDAVFTPSYPRSNVPLLRPHIGVERDIERDIWSVTLKKKHRFYPLTPGFRGFLHINGHNGRFASWKHTIYLFI